MIKDRRELVQHELDKAKVNAAGTYFFLVTHFCDKNHPKWDLYQEYKNKVVSLQMDLDIIDQLLRDGHE